MRQVLAVLLLLLTSACSEVPERTWTVSEFMADSALRSDHLRRCRENPGSLQNTANCKNAEEAEGRMRLQRMNRALGG
ncbi:EexN family lipoprotein [Brucella tritici]|uniref:EexN family lipoprotein n=1 Tax=Brucella tritici TaxID=94626 RepID=A0A7V7VQJ2_9HYPH|nr:EexN family lipoprotein [Brucella tritici]KAB2654874.1 EexN family lipoprotein [Brucella tritici]